MQSTKEKTRSKLIPVPVFIFHENLPEKKTSPLGITRSGATCPKLTFPTLGQYIEQQKINELMITQINKSHILGQSAITDITRLVLFRTLQIRIPQILHSYTTDTKNFLIQKDIQLAKIKCTLMAAGLTTLVKNSFPEFSSQQRSKISAILHNMNQPEEVYAGLFIIKQKSLQNELLRAIHSKRPLSYLSGKRERLAFSDLAKKTVKSLNKELIEQLFVLPENRREPLIREIAIAFSNYYQLTASFPEIVELLREMVPKEKNADIGWSLTKSDNQTVELSIQAAAQADSHTKLRLHVLHEKFDSLQKRLLKKNATASIDFPERDNADTGVIRLKI